MATLTNSNIKIMEIIRVFEKHGIENFKKAFNSELNDKVKAFLMD